MPAYIWSNVTQYKEKVAERCADSAQSGSIEPIDLLEGGGDSASTTLLDAAPPRTKFV
jgi:hypothetical protein